MSATPPSDIQEMPTELRAALGEYGPQVIDSGCGETIGWGHKLIKQISQDDFAKLSDYGELHGLGYGTSQVTYALITKWITPFEAREKYGSERDLKVGPRGGFKSVMYGDRQFLSKKLDPRT